MKKLKMLCQKIVTQKTIHWLRTILWCILTYSENFLHAKTTRISKILHTGRIRKLRPNFHFSLTSKTEKCCNRIRIKITPIQPKLLILRQKGKNYSFELIEKFWKRLIPLTFHFLSIMSTKGNIDTFCE